MGRWLILVLFLNSVAIFSQELQFSRYYAGGGKRVPLQIINTHPDYFYVLRYNREIHDFIIEKRGKPSAELIRIYPLQLDSVNAHWFDYEQLDYTLFEKDRQLCFVFQKVLNNERTIYLKQIDSAGHLSSFIPLLSLSKEAQHSQIDIVFSITSEKCIQVVTRQDFTNRNSRKVVYLFDPSSKKLIFKKALPIENAFSGSSLLHASSKDGRLYYFQVFAELTGYQSRYTNYGQVQEPVYRTDSVKLMLIDAFQNLHGVKLNTGSMTAFQAAGIYVSHNAVRTALRYNSSDTTKRSPLLFVNTWNEQLSNLIDSNQISLNESISAQLNYFDGSDQASAAAKSFRALPNTTNKNSMWEERVEGNFYKEILMWDWDAFDGRLVHQYLLPRKVFFFPNRTNFRQLGSVAIVEDSAGTSCFVLENRFNQTQDPKQYNHRDFNKQTHLRHGSLVQYRLENGTIKKRILFENSEFDFIPMRYVGWNKDYVFYLNKARAEKFVILKDCRF
jgi:hypothetical protein